MKTQLFITRSLLILFLIFNLTSCTEEESTTYTELKIKSNSKTLSLNSDKEFIFEVTDEEGNIYSDEATYFVDDSSISGNSFFEENIGLYTVFAEYEGARTQTIQLSIIDVLPTTFSKKIIVEEFTATWCANCPALNHKIHDLVLENSNIIPIAIHGDDILEYELISVLEDFHSVNGYPNAYIDRYERWLKTRDHLYSYLNKEAELGLGISSIIEKDEIKIDIKLAFSKNSSEKLKLGVYILENNFIYPQSDYDADGGVVQDYEHNDILRKSVTDIFGDEIVSSTSVGDFYAKQFKIAIPSSIKNLENISIVSFVVNESNEILNAQIAPINTIKDFD